MTEHSPPAGPGARGEVNEQANEQVNESVYDKVYDVAVIGAGVVGSAIARDLSGHDLSVVLLDARDDVGDGTSKANTAILHTGFDAKPGTLESRLVRRGYELLSAYADDTGIPVERTGALLVAWTPEEQDALPGLREKAVANGYEHCEPVTAEEVYRQVPALGPGALGGLTVPDESIICTWTTTLALATDATARGTTVLLGHRVDAVEGAEAGTEGTAAGESTAGTEAAPGGDTTTLRTSRGSVTARWVVNAAGLGADALDGLFGHRRFTVTPRRGELLVFDKLARPLADRIVLPVPSSLGKGVLISPTIYGNVMLGPTAEDLTDRTDTGTSESGFEFLRTKGTRLMPTLLEEEVTASYAGLRAAIDHGDYLIEPSPEQRYLLVGGIRSTGLTASLAIAEHVRGVLAEAGLKLEPRLDLPEPPRMPNLGEAYLRPYQDAALIAEDSAYGRIVCFCERVTEGEIRDAYRSPLPPAGLDGLRRRTRAMNGRCQGFYCGATVDALMATKGGTCQEAAK
ncbi:NAD(P)/FAD-dependent oxidoreductase [Streptomyces paludis]|uniref:FAD/NAD(P)-binding oxidoreductase n=1 Tax=Streptomyces paludis TaxID=2282738 RepID=A0A345HUL2_9ACTN|nr:FAD/NAD(P)-binding oxidoreductase [Streptomyces paludis]